jgi:hypothetical protein
MKRWLSGWRLAGLIIFVLWTAHWGGVAWSAVRAETAFGTGAWRPTLELWHVMEVQFVALHYVLRWAAGALLLAALAAGAWFRRRRQRVVVTGGAMPAPPAGVREEAA